MGSDLLPEGFIQLHLEHLQGRRRHHLSAAPPASLNIHKPFLFQFMLQPAGLPSLNAEKSLVLLSPKPPLGYQQAPLTSRLSRAGSCRLSSRGRGPRHPSATPMYQHTPRPGGSSTLDMAKELLSRGGRSLPVSLTLTRGHGENLLGNLPHTKWMEIEAKSS